MRCEHGFLDYTHLYRGILCYNFGGLLGSEYAFDREVERLDVYVRGGKRLCKGGL